MLERIEINLLPAEYRVHRKSIRLPREIVWPMVGILILGCFIGWIQVSMDGEIAQLNRTVTEIDQRIQQNQHVKAEIEQLQSVHSAILQKIRALERISVNKEKWVRLLEILCGYLPRYTWLTNVAEQGGGSPESSLRLAGSTFSFPEVASYMSRLTESDYIKAVDLSGIEQSGNETRNPVFQFTLSAAIDPDAGLGRLNGRGSAQPGQPQ